MKKTITRYVCCNEHGRKLMNLELDGEYKRYQYTNLLSEAVMFYDQSACQAMCDFLNIQSDIHSFCVAKVTEVVEG